MLIDKNKATLLVVDVQEKLLPQIWGSEDLSARLRWLIAASQDGKLPIVFSEQYPKGLGHTLAPLRELAPTAPVVDKRHFSCVAAACLPPELLAREQVVVCGIEAHVCVLQTALELAAQGKQVFVVADAIGSRRPLDVELALERMRVAGVVVVSREMVLFELLRGAHDPDFKAMSQKYLQGAQPA